MQVEIKTFQELSTEELYALLQLRNEVFVVEQDCVYQDMDGKDAIAIHVLGKENQKLAAYARIFAAGNYFENTAIGRVVVAKPFRKKGLARAIMRASLDYIEKHIGTDKIELSAQTYLTDFYDSIGFKKEGKEYLEDGIPHIKMVNDNP